MAAVSARKIVGPSDADIHPAFTKSCISSSAHPPSGPIARTISPPRRDAKTSRSRCSCSDSARTMRTASPFRVTASDNLTGASISGGAARRDCSAACSAILRQRSARCTAAEARSSIRAPRDHRHNPLNAQLRTFLDRPLHPIKLKNRKQQRDLRHRDLRHRRRGNFLAQLKFNSPITNAHNPPAPHYCARRNIELLPHPRPQHANEMIRMIAREGGAIPRKFLGDPSSSCHGMNKRPADQRRNVAKEMASVADLKGRGFSRAVNPLLSLRL